MKRNRDHLSMRYAENIYNNDFQEYSYNEMAAFSRYCGSLGWGKDRIENEIIKRCIKNENFNLVLNYKMIHSAVSKFKQVIKKDVDGIWITQNEMDFFKSVPEKYGKILFIVLVVAKQNNPDYNNTLYYNLDLNEAIRAITNTKMTKDEIDGFNYWCGYNGYLLATRKSWMCWELKYFGMDKDNKVLWVDDLKHPLKFYPAFCEKCGKQIIKKSNRQKMCDNCASEANKEQMKLGLKKFRSNEKN